MHWVRRLVDVIAEPGSLGGGLPFQDMNPIADEIVAFLAVADVAERDEKLILVDEAVTVFDEVILPAVREPLQDVVLSLLTPTPMNMMEIIECLGGDAVAEALGWAANTLAGNPQMARPDEAIRGIAACLEWDPAIIDASDDIVASAIIYSYVAAINMMLAELASTP